MQSNDQRQQWQPPPRPEWVQRINEEGYCMNISGVVPLDEKSLLEAAMRATGLSDFGTDEWREPFRVFIKALEEEADLNLVGRIRTRSEILQLLESRLQIEDSYKRHPQIEDEEIMQPIIVIGQGRSGTSFLINMLAADPDNGVMLEWEAMLPCPPPEAATYPTDPRIEKAHRRIDQWNRVTPTLKSMHEFGGNMPEECCQVMAFSFMAPSWLDCFGQVPSWDAYMTTADITPALRYHKRVLKLLQWKNPRKRWVLKDVMFLDYMAPILRVYPDACFIWSHRDPVRALASTVSMIGTVQWGRSDHPFKGGSFEMFLDPALSAQRLNHVIDQLEAGVVPARQFCNVLYPDLVGETMGTLEGVYRQFDIPLSAGSHSAMAKFLTENPRDARPAHKISGTSDAAVAVARKAYKRYQEYFKIRNE